MDEGAAQKPATEGSGNDPGAIGPAKSDPPEAGSFVVELARSGLTLTIPAGGSILDVVRAAGVQANSVANREPAAPAKPACWRAYPITMTRC
jgi:hypothetical protein